jgi:hypothetical protein
MLQKNSILWRRLDRAGHDAARLTERSPGPVLEGAAVFAEAGQPCRLDYRVACDATWRTVSASINGWLGERAIAIHLAVDLHRRWLLNGAPCAEVEGCDDVDLSFSPATNLLPLRRLRMNVGGRAAVRAAWLRFPECRLEPLDQVYERIDDSTYQYESDGGAFVTTLQVDATGFVTQYPNLWCEEA